MSNRDFLAELKRRNVIRMAVLYPVGEWLDGHLRGDSRFAALEQQSDFPALNP